MIKTYTVKKADQKIDIDADPGKPVWRNIEAIRIEYIQPPVPADGFLPVTTVKAAYDDDHLYVIFIVQDRYVRAAATKIHGEVWKDSCVEFFFTPHRQGGSAYFNLETNCCGVFLLRHQAAPNQDIRFVDLDDCRRIKIASSLKPPITGEITEPTDWTIEYSIPFDILEKYSDIERPAPGVEWNANFYKCADDSSHPHWLTWSEVPSEKPNFHQPQHFGTLKFE